MNPRESVVSADRPSRLRWGSSVRGSLRQWALSSVSSLSASEQGEWFCERCTYRNADSAYHTCALCGWNRVTRVVDRNNETASPAPAPLAPDFSIHAESEDDSSSTMQTSNVGHAEDTFDIPQPSTVSVGLSLDTVDPSLRGVALAPTNSTTSTHCSSSGNWWDENEASIIESRGGGLCSKQYCKNCSNRVALIWLLLLLILVSGVTILAVLVKEKNANGSQAASAEGSVTGDATSNPSPTPLPTDAPAGPMEPSPDPPATTQLPTLSPVEQPDPPSASPTLSPTAPPSGVPSVSPTQSPTFPPTLPDSVSLVKLGETIIGAGVGNSFGDSIVMSEDGRIIAISAPQPRLNWQERPGAVQVFKLFQDEWRQLGGDLLGEANRDFFGRALSLSKDGLTIAVGGPGNDAAGQDAGHAMVYRFSESEDEWKQLGTDIDGADLGKGFGLSISLAENVVAIGAKRYAEVYSFSTQEMDWISLGDPIINSGDNGDRWKVALSKSDSGLSLAVGAPGPSTGYVRVYDNDKAGNWVQRGLISDEIGFDYEDACISVALSENGDIVAVRATTALEDLTKVFVYNRDTGDWKRMGLPIYWSWPLDFWAWWWFDIDCSEYSQSLTLSSDGHVVVINGDGGPLMFWFNDASDSWDELADENGKMLVGDTVSLSKNGKVIAVEDESNRRVNVFEIQ